MQNQKYIIITISLLMFVGVMFLGFIEYKQKTGEESQGWWSVYFIAPYDEKSLDFVIENYDKKTEFTYEVALGNEVVKTEKVVVENNEFKKVELSDISIFKSDERFAEIKISLNGEKESKSILKK